MDLPTIATSSLVAALVAFWLNRAFDWMANGEKARSLLHGIALEVEHAEICARAYLKESAGGAWSPGYRIETEFMQRGIAEVAALGKLRGDEASSIHAFYIASGEANRSLEWLAHHHANPPAPIDVENRLAATGLFRPHPIALETSRARLKFETVLTRLPAARQSVEQALARLSWYEQR